MNQVMINAVELDLMMKEIADLKEKVASLEALLKTEREYVKLLKAEVAWAENGYTKKGDTP